MCHNNRFVTCIFYLELCLSGFCYCEEPAGSRKTTSHHERFTIKYTPHFCIVQVVGLLLLLVVVIVVPSEVVLLSVVVLAVVVVPVGEAEPVGVKEVLVETVVEVVSVFVSHALISMEPAWTFPRYEI